MDIHFCVYYHTQSCSFFKAMLIPTGPGHSVIIASSGESSRMVRTLHHCQTSGIAIITATQLTGKCDWKYETFFLFLFSFLTNHLMKIMGKRIAQWLQL